MLFRHLGASVWHYKSAHDKGRGSQLDAKGGSKYGSFLQVKHATGIASHSSAQLGRGVPSGSSLKV